MTLPYAEVIGDPIAHSKSPRIHGFWLERLGLAGAYRACHVRPDELPGYLSARRADATWRGCNVTIPHKEAIAPLLDGRDARAAGVGAVNTVIRDADGRLIGTNTDVDGVAEAVADTPLAGRRVVVLGVGGAARAAFAFLAAQNCEATVLARSLDKARSAVEACGLTAEVRPFAPGSGAFAGAGLVINATQLGMTGQGPMPAFVLDEMEDMAADGLVFDMVYAPLETALLARARATGRRGADGLTMLVGQAATAFARFFGQPAPRACDAELRAMLTA